MSGGRGAEIKRRVEVSSHSFFREKSCNSGKENIRNDDVEVFSFVVEVVEVKSSTKF